jgi:hypothetical protein
MFDFCVYAANLRALGEKESGQLRADAIIHLT